MCYHQCIVSSIEDVSHNTKLYAFQLPKSVYMRVPLGYHVYAQAEICGMLEDEMQNFNARVWILFVFIGGPGLQVANRIWWLYKSTLVEWYEQLVPPIRWTPDIFP